MSTNPADSNTQILEEQGIPTDLHRPGPVTILLVLFVFLALVAGLYYLGYGPHQRQADEANRDAAERVNSIPTVGVSKPHQTVSSKDILLPCDIRPNQQTALYARASGYLKKLYVDINDHVQAGQLLAEIDTPEIDAQLTQSQANLELAKANLIKAQSDMDLSQRTLDRYQHLPPGAASAQDLDQKKSACDDAATTVAQAKAAVAVAQADVQRLTVLQGFEKVTAPFAGTISARNYDVGALLSASGGKQLFDLVQSDTLRVTINVPQIYSTDIKVGEPVYLSVRNYPGRQFQGTIARTSDILTTGTRTMLFEATFANPEGLLHAGMYGQVRLNLAKQKPVLVIPTSAMLFNTDGTQVAVVENDKVHFQPITIGRDLGTEMEILSGLPTDAQIIANPAAHLSEGAHVKPVLLQKLAETPKPTTQPLAHSDHEAKAKVQ